MVCWGQAGAERRRKSAQEKPKPTNKSKEKRAPHVELSKWGPFRFLHLPEILFLFTGVSSEYGFGSFEYLQKWLVY